MIKEAVYDIIISGIEICGKAVENMKLIFTIDENNGMLFLGKRQSKDKALRQKIADITKGYKLWMSVYSKSQFENFTNIIVDDDYMEKAGPEDFCFVEDKPFCLEGVDTVVLCHWNRSYQATEKFDVDLIKEGFLKTDTQDIIGTSHDRITIEVYKRG